MESISRRSALAGAAIGFAAVVAACQMRDSTPRWTDVASDQVGTAPYRSIGSLGVWRGTQLMQHFGTVWICAPQRLATAAHVLEDARAYMLGSGEALRVRLGYTRGVAPVEDVVVTAEQLKPHDDYDSDSANYDIGVVECAVVGPSLLGEVCKDQEAQVLVCGYPVARSSRFPVYSGDKIVSHGGLAWRQDNYFVHDTDTATGHSGAPILRAKSDGAWEAIAIHFAPEGDINNKGVWINEELAVYLRG